MKKLFAVSLATAALSFGAVIDISTGTGNANWQVTGVAAVSLTTAQVNAAWAPAPAGASWVSWNAQQGTSCALGQNPGTGCANTLSNPSGDTWQYTLTIPASALAGSSSGTLNFIFGADSRVSLTIGQQSPEVWNGGSTTNGDGFSPLGCSGNPPTSAGSTQQKYVNCVNSVPFSPSDLNADGSLTLTAIVNNDPIPDCPLCGDPTAFILSGTLVTEPGNILPQFAFGGGWYSALYFTNLRNTPVGFLVSFVSDSGAPLAVPSVGTSTQVILGPRGSTVIEAPNSGDLQEGYAHFALPDGIYGYGVFRQSVAGRVDQEAVAPFAEAGVDTSTIAWDDTNSITAVAIVNPGSTTETVTIKVWDNTGDNIGNATISLDPGCKTETVLRSLPGLNAMMGKRGSAQFTAPGGSVAVLGIRFDGFAFTDIPTTTGQ